MKTDVVLRHRDEFRGRRQLQQGKFFSDRKSGEDAVDVPAAVQLKQLFCRFDVLRNRVPAERKVSKKNRQGSRRLEKGSFHRLASDLYGGDS